MKYEDIIRTEIVRLEKRREKVEAQEERECYHNTIEALLWDLMDYLGYVRLNRRSFRGYYG